MLVLREPLVMLSSTISELDRLRRQVAERVNRLALAHAWRFEEHAAAAGTAPEVEYLGVASTCDLYVLIIAARQSDATEAEYAAAYADNPEKVLAFFLGDGSAGVAPFRQLVESRHTRVKRDSVDELVEPMVAAILEAIETGRAIRQLLIADIERRIERARTAITDIAVVHLPYVTVHEESRRAVDVITAGAHVALSGIGGSGKTMAAAIAMRSAASDGRVLPIYVEPSENRTDIVALVQERLHSVRFEASDELTRRWGHQGRLMVVIDGVEGLSSVARRRVMDAATRWAEEFPRSGIVVCARRYSTLELIGFTHASAAPLADEQIQVLTNVLGAARPVRLPEQVRDIGRWPLWAVALLVYGPQAATGLELLQRLIDARLTTAGMSSVIEEAELRASAAFIASHQWPATTASADDVLEVVERWSRQSASGRKFTPRPAEDIIKRLGEAGLVEVGDEIVFPHRLLATILAAEDMVSQPGSDGTTDDEELAPFVAALADDDDHVDLVHSVLGAHSVFVLARFLRLSPPRQRSAAIESDVQRAAVAVRRWTASSDELDVVHSDTWIAWRASDRFSLRTIAADEYVRWRSRADQPITFWPMSPFFDHTPEFVAAVYALNRFRDKVLAADPGGNSFAHLTDEEVAALAADDATLEAAVLEALQRQRQIREELLDRLGLAEADAFRSRAGEPQVSVWVEAGRLMVQLVRDGEMPTVTRLDRAPEWIHGSRSTLAAMLTPDAEAAVYASVVRDVEAELGCRLGAQNWRRAELIPAWAW